MDDFDNNNEQFTPPIPPVSPVQPENTTIPQPPVNNNTSYQQAPIINAPYVSVQKTTDGLGIASMILGIVSIVICCCYGAGLLLAIPGLILGLVAKKSPQTGSRSGFAIAGIIISAISIGLNLICLIYMIYNLVEIGTMTTGDLEDFMKDFGYDAYTKL